MFKDFDIKKVIFKSINVILFLFRAVIITVLDVLFYLMSRIVLLFTILQIAIEIFLEEIDSFKDYLMKHMFWGRGVSYKYFAQLSLVFIVVAMLFLSSYTMPITSIFSENNVYSYYQGNSEKDLLVASGDVETIIPEDLVEIEMQTYVVKKDDTLSGIAKQFNVNVDSILWANNMTKAHTIKTGMVLKIPPGVGVMHTVKKGDTVQSIAKKYKVDAQGIVDLNWLPRNLTLTVGQQIFVPDAVIEEEVPQQVNNSGGGSKVNIGPADPNVGKFLTWPVAGGRGTVSRCYTGYHPAIDIYDFSAPDIVAAADGTVVFSGWKTSYGWVVEIDHGNGYMTVYGHMQKLYVVSGQGVTRGTAIGQMGSTGRSTGLHVHFELRKGSEYKNAIDSSSYVSTFGSGGCYSGFHL